MHGNYINLNTHTYRQVGYRGYWSDIASADRISRVPVGYHGISSDIVGYRQVGYRQVGYRQVGYRQVGYQGRISGVPTRSDLCQTYFEIISGSEWVE